MTSIVPHGPEHALLALGLVLLTLRPAPAMGQFAALAAGLLSGLVLGTEGLLTVPSGIIPPVIGASLVALGLWNVLADRVGPGRIVLVLLIGGAQGLALAHDAAISGADGLLSAIGFAMGAVVVLLAVVGVALAITRGTAPNRPVAAALFAAMALVWLLVIPLEGIVPMTQSLPFLAALSVLLGLSATARLRQGDDRMRQVVSLPASVLIAVAGAAFGITTLVL